MSIYSPSSPFTSVPPEIWLQIFRTATYIPGEWDTSATTPYSGLFTSWDPLQERAYRVVLPLRRTIVQVSRLWWEIGSEVLYASFYSAFLYGHISPGTLLDHFERSLSARPALGRFVKRLALIWPQKGHSSKIDHVLQLCPNTLILSFYDMGAPYDGSWKPTILTNHVRILDATVRFFSQKEIVQVLCSLVSLEILHLAGLKQEPEESSHHGTLRLSALRLLSLSFQDRQAVGYWAPLLLTADLPRLTSLSTNLGGGPLPFAIDIWQRITFFQCILGGHDALKPEMFRSLTQLHLGIEDQPLRHQQSHFPFHQLHHLTIFCWVLPYSPVTGWKRIMEGFLALPLSRSEMPLLRVLGLEWEEHGIQGYSILTSEHGHYSSFLDYLESLTLEFERVGVQFQEVIRSNIYHIPTPMKDVIKNTRDNMRIPVL